MNEKTLHDWKRDIEATARDQVEQVIQTAPEEFRDDIRRHVATVLAVRAFQQRQLKS